MALSIDQLRNAFNKKSETQNTGFWDKFYPFYKMETDQTAVVRFLPDKNENNPMGFIVENKYHELVINGQKKKIACLKMFDESCPLCEESSKHYNEGNTDLGKKYYRKIDYIGQAIVNSSPFDYENKDGNPVRLISMGPMIFKKIEAAFKSGDLDKNPTDMVEGYDFRIVKSKKGEYADYSTSDFARKQSPISEDILAVMELYNLADFRFTKVDRDTMEAMLQSDKTGKSFNESKDQQNDESAKPEATHSAESSSKINASEENKSSSSSSSTGKPNAEDILAKIRARTAAKAQE